MYLKDYNGRGNCELVLKQLAEVMQYNEDKHRQSVVWCHFGKIFIEQQSEGNCQLVLRGYRTP